MKLTPKNKTTIDAKSYEALLSHWRSAPFGDPWFTGETGDYWSTRISELRDADPDGAIAASKSIGF